MEWRRTFEVFSRISKIIKNPYVLSMIAKAYGVAVGFLFTVFQARFLGAAIKGQVATVNSIVSIAMIVLSFGIYQAYPYYKRNNNEDLLPVFIKVSLLMLVVYSLISLVALLLFDLSEKYIAVFLITPLFVYDWYISYITLVESPNKRHLTDMLVMLVELVLVVVLWALAKPTFFLGILIIVIKNLIKASIFTFLWRKKIFVASGSLRIWFPKLVKFGVFPMLALLLSTLNYRLDVLMLNGRVSDTMIGIYSIGVLIAERLWMVPDALRGVMVSNLTKGKGVEEVAYVIRLCNTLCLLIVLVFIALGEPFIRFVFGAEYQGAYSVMLILLAGVFSMIYYKTIASYHIAMGKQVISFVLLGISVLCNVVANLLLIPTMGIYGAGIASVISYTICSVLFICIFCSQTGISFAKMLIVDKEDCKKLIKKLGRDKS